MFLLFIDVCFVCIHCHGCLFLFIYVWLLGSLLLRAALLWQWRVGTARQLQRAGFSLWWALQLQSIEATDFSSCSIGAQDCGSQALEHAGFRSGGVGAVEVPGLQGCGLWAQLFCGRQNLTGPGIEPMFLALASGFLSTAPTGMFLKRPKSSCPRNIHSPSSSFNRLFFPVSQQKQLFLIIYNNCLFKKIKLYIKV